MAAHSTPTAQRILVQPVARPGNVKGWPQKRGLAHQTFNEMSFAIATATASGKRMNPVVRDFLRNLKVRLSAAMRALGGEPDEKEAVELGKNVNAWADRYMPVTWYCTSKADGSSRPICILPPDLKAVHYMIAEVIGQQLERSDALYGVPGFSRDDAARNLNTLQSAGYVHLAKTDIVDCFQSINPSALYELPLPQEVTRRALDLRNLSFIENRDHRASQLSYSSSLCVHHGRHKASGPKGLMQGSPASNIILAWLLNSIPSADDAKVMLCFDNIVVAARTMAACREMVDTLTAHFERCSAGPLALCDPEFADNTPMEFLGYVFDPARSDIGIGDGARHRLEHRLSLAEAQDEAKLAKLWHEHQRRLAENRLFEFIDPFNGHYPLGVWQALLNFRAGFPAASPEGHELAFYLENSAQVADMRQNWYVKHFHNNLFAQRGTFEGASIRQIFRMYSDQSNSH